MIFTDTHIADINKLCVDYHVKQLYVFGSALRKDINMTGDIDFLVDFEKVDSKSYADNYFALKYGLQNLFKRPVDLLEESSLKNPYVKESVIQQRELIYGH